MAGSEPAQAMTGTDLLRRVRQCPFVPFRLVVSEGPAYDVRRPDQVMVMCESVLIGVPAEPEQDAYETNVLVDLRHIVRLEPLAAGP
jgi:hypothetical protein